jgi:hypothetical protein
MTKRLPRRLAATNQRLRADKPRFKIIRCVCDARTVRRALQHDLEHGDILLHIPLAKVLPCALILRKYDHLQTQLQLFEDDGV